MRPTLAFLAERRKQSEFQPVTCSRIGIKQIDSKRALKDRLVSFADGKVTFRWRDSAHQNEQKVLPLSVDEFLRRFLLHLLPQGFVRIRNFGFLANRRRATTLPLCFQLLGSAPPTKTQVPGSSSDTWLCPKCGGPMLVMERLAAAELQLRAPPTRDAVAA
jgi:putative transposase